MPYVVVDLLGTLFTFEKVIEKIQVVLGGRIERLKNEKDAKLFFRYWYNWALCDHISSSYMGTYVPLKTVLKQTLTRSVRCFFEDEECQLSVTENESQMIMLVFQVLTADPQAIKAFETLVKHNRTSDEQWYIWLISSLSYEDTIELLELSQLDKYIESRLLSCDDIQKSKPHPQVYSEIMRMAVRSTKKIENFYLIGSSVSDLSSARNISMRTIFLNKLDKHYPDELYENGPPNITATSFLECIQKMIDFEASRKYLY